MVEDWREHSRNILRACGDRPAILRPDGACARTFADVLAEAERFAHLLEPLPAGEAVSIALPNRAEFLGAVLGVFFSGRPLLMLDVSGSATLLAEAERSCGVAVRICEDSGEVVLRGMDSGRAVWVNDAPDFLKMTSGSSGAPRMACFSLAQLAADAGQVCETMGITDRDLNYGVIAFSHSYGFSNLVTPLLFHGIPLVAANDLLPRAVANGLLQTGATVLPGVPPLWQALSGLPDAIPPSLRLCISAGAPLRVGTATAFLARTGRKVHSFYGSSECGGICYDASENPDVPEGSVGEPMSNVMLEWAEVPAPEGARMVVTGPAVGLEYHPAGDAAVLGGGRFCPDDLLVRDSGGFRIVGRVSDFINVGGRKIHPSWIERALLRHPAVSDAVAFAGEATRGGEEVVACVMVRGKTTPAELQVFVSKMLPAWQRPRRVEIVASFPRTSRGKVNRVLLAKAGSFGEF